MTPESWTTEALLVLGAVWSVLGALVCIGAGVLMRRRLGIERSIGLGLSVWAAGNLLSAGLIALHLQVDSVVVTVAPTRCEPGTDVRGRPGHTHFHALQRPGEPAHEVRTATRSGVCPEDTPQPHALRVRKDALASSRPVISGEPADDDGPQAVMGVCGAFGAVGALFGWLLLAQARNAGRPTPPAPVPRPVAAWRTGLANLLGQLGLLVFLAAFVVPWLLDGSTERGVQFGMRCVASAMATWLLSGLAAGTLTVGATVFLVSFGGVLLGVAELLR